MCRAHLTGRGHSVALGEGGRRPPPLPPRPWESQLAFPSIEYLFVGLENNSSNFFPNEFIYGGLQNCAKLKPFVSDILIEGLRVNIPRGWCYLSSYLSCVPVCG